MHRPSAEKPLGTLLRKIGGKTFIPEKISFINAFRKTIKQTFYRVIRKKDRGIVKIAKLAQQYGTQVIIEEDVNSISFCENMRIRNIELIVSAAYPQIFSKQLLSIPRCGAVNFHPSLLPRFRGAHPHYWAIRTGEEVSGITAHFMTEHIDEGDLVAQLSFSIKELDYKQLYEKINLETPSLVKKVDEFFADPTSKAIPQDVSRVSCYRQDREIHHRVFWNLHDSRNILNLVRTLAGFCFYGTIKINLQKVTVVDSNRNMTNGVGVEPGTIVDLLEHGPVVKTLDAFIIIDEFSIDGCCGYVDWVNRHNVTIGVKFQ